ncbi:hypothetical protein DTO012A7_3692 [Penicillium roqueforti]|nr:hypothetical protein LCP963914a_3257 [Penicillium roqueforti]KAI2702430.1 hypothetical protein CBS147372_4163 [Penicillium roqueforti]KAI2728161.1 hypothetical protein CBS147354_2694 [Penicillium roqueforti]KAI3109625.1 hypothetical protein CBS147333_5272 [Penicillium roqueforti]KAI3144804.1 hypothetical protein CBS147325_4989 [Penicillium roqueforti]
MTPEQTGPGQNQHADGEPGSGPTNPPKSAAAAATFKKGPRFYAILVAICFVGMMTALEGTITSTALPSIIADLGGGDRYVWAVNGYFLAMTALQPLQGQLANVFGRRWPTIISTATFILGSGIGGGASNMSMLIAGRVIQGVGAGGINVLIEIIVCDLIPLRQRGQYIGMIFGVIALGTALGPLFGGLIVQHTTWRWVFYLNLPIGGVALVILILFLHVKYNQEKTFADKLTQIDWLGNVLFVATISAILIALSWAGAVYPWSSYHVIVPLVIGMLGLVGFMLFEASPRLAPHPMMPLHLFSNRTSAIAFILTFLHGIITIWALFFLPVYFQGVLGSSTTRSGIQLLPTILALVPFAGLGGTLMSKLGQYRFIHGAGFALVIIGFGLLTLLDERSNTGSWVGFQIIQSAGAGLVIPTLLPAVLAPLTEADTALATATWSFLRTFGMMWGTAIPAAILNNRFDSLAPGRIGDQRVRTELLGGQAYEHATAAFRNTLPSETLKQFVSVLSDSIKRTWQVAIAFAALGLLVVLLEKDVPLRQELDTEFGLDEKGKSENAKDSEAGVDTSLVVEKKE